MYIVISLHFIPLYWSNFLRNAQDVVLWRELCMDANTFKREVKALHNFLLPFSSPLLYIKSSTQKPGTSDWKEGPHIDLTIKYLTMIRISCYLVTPYSWWPWSAFQMLSWAVVWFGAACCNQEVVGTQLGQLTEQLRATAVNPAAASMMWKVLWWTVCCSWYINYSQQVFKFNSPP